MRESTASNSRIPLLALLPRLLSLLCNRVLFATLLHDLRLVNCTRVIHKLNQIRGSTFQHVGSNSDRFQIE